MCIVILILVVFVIGMISVFGDGGNKTYSSDISNYKEQTKKILYLTDRFLRGLATYFDYIVLYFDFNNSGWSITLQVEVGTISYEREFGRVITKEKLLGAKRLSILAADEVYEYLSKVRGPVQSDNWIHFYYDYSNVYDKQLCQKWIKVYIKEKYPKCEVVVENNRVCVRPNKYMFF